MELVKLIVNDKITASSQTNIHPKHYIKRYKTTKMNFDKLLG